MKLTDIPSKLNLPFGINGNKNVIPDTTTTSGVASLDQGFPPETMEDPTAGGVPPDGKDFNGILFDVSGTTRWSNAGGLFPYDATFSTAIGGYPQGAQVLASNGLAVFVSQIDDNTSNPEDASLLANWVGYGGNVIVLSETAGNVPLTPLQAASTSIFVTGTLTGDLVLYFPAWSRTWEVTNLTTGAFNVFVEMLNDTNLIQIPQNYTAFIYGYPNPPTTLQTNKILYGLGPAATYSVGLAAGQLITTDAADARYLSSGTVLGTASQRNIGTGATDVPDIQTADARYAPIGSGGSTSAGLAPNGWWKDNATGVITQWGRTNVLHSIVTFAIAFPNICTGVSAMQTDGGDVNKAQFWWSIQLITTTQFEVFSLDNGGQGGGQGTFDGNAIWMATGY